MSKFKAGDKVVRKPKNRDSIWIEMCEKNGFNPSGCFVVEECGCQNVYLAGGMSSWFVEFFDLADTPQVGEQPKSKDMKHDQGKPRMDLLIDGCPRALEAVAGILTFGAEKYADHSWQGVERGEERYKAALLRHLTAVSKGEANDSESGMSHLAHAACNALFILELELRKNA